MRGEILSFDPQSGVGWISGADGLRYSFTTADLAASIPAYPGARLDFVPTGRTATQIFPAPEQALAPPAWGGGFFSPVTPDPVGEPDLSIWAYAKRCLRKYADFEGRARRKEYWSFVLAELLVMLPLYLILFGLFMLLGAYGSADGSAAPAAPNPAVVPLGILTGVLFLTVFVIALARVVPSYAVLARRFHDVGLSAWWILVVFVPFVGVLIYVVLFMPSQPGANIYGRYPKPVARTG